MSETKNSEISNEPPADTSEFIEMKSTKKMNKAPEPKFKPYIQVEPVIKFDQKLGDVPQDLRKTERATYYSKPPIYKPRTSLDVNPRSRKPINKDSVAHPSTPP